MNINEQKAKILRIAGILLIVVGVLVFLQPAFTDVYAKYHQRQLLNQWKKITDNSKTKDGHEDGQLESEATTQASGTAQTTGKGDPAVINRYSVGHKQPFARIVIPKIGLDAIVVEGTDEKALRLGPGHMKGTALPGEPGNMVISGHRVTYNRPFDHLDKLEKGDPIYVYARPQKGLQKYTYYVNKTKVVKPTDLSVTKPTKDRTLTLTTCNPRFSASTRLIVIAKMIDNE